RDRDRDPSPVCPSCGKVKGEIEVSREHERDSENSHWRKGENTRESERGTRIELKIDVDLRPFAHAVNKIEYQNQGEDSRVRFSARTITCLTITGNKATIFGSGDFRSGRNDDDDKDGRFRESSHDRIVNFQLDITNNPGFADSFKLQLSNGFVSSG